MKKKDLMVIVCVFTAVIGMYSFAYHGDLDIKTPQSFDQQNYLQSMMYE